MKFFRRSLALFLSLSLLGFGAGVSASALPQSSFASLPAQKELNPVFAVIQKLLQYLGVQTETVSFTFDERGAIFSKNEYTAMSHASTIVKTGEGSFVAAWFGGDGEGSANTRIWVSSYENGTWSKAFALPSDQEVGHWNPVLQNSGSFLRLYFKCGSDTASWITEYSDSYDRGKTWSKEAELVAGDTSGGRGPSKNKCLVTSSGLIIAPGSTEKSGWKAFFDLSSDGGKTWTKTADVAVPIVFGKETSMIQPTLWEDENGIHAFFRTKSGAIFRSDSLDGGYHWCEAYRTSLPGNNSGIDCVRTDNGWLWLVYNPARVGIRSTLRLSVSKDNGKTWQTVTDLEGSALLYEEYSYPAIIASGNHLYITYTGLRRQIKYAFITFEG